MLKVCILSPFQDQALYLCNMFKKNGFLVDGFRFPGEPRFHDKFFDKIIASDDSLNEEEYKWIIPTGAKSTEWFLSQGICRPSANIPFDIKNLFVSNKPQMLDLCEKLGVPIPRNIDIKSEIRSYPLFYKDKYEKKIGMRGLVKNSKQLPDKKYWDDLIFQDYIQGEATYGVGFIAVNGEIKIYSTHKESFSVPKTGGSAVVMEDFSDIRLLDYTKKLVEKLDYTGWGLAEFKYSKKIRDYVFMEINAKFWASLAYSFHNEPNFPLLLFNIKLDRNKRKGVVFFDRLLLSGPLSTILKIPKLFRYKVFTLNSLCYSFAKGLIPSQLRQKIKGQ